MRGGMTIDVYIPKGILKEPGRAHQTLLVHRRQPCGFPAAGHARRDASAVVV